MARNGGKSRGAQPRQSGGGGGGKRWPFFVGGLLLGLLLSFGVYLLKILPTAMELRERAKAHAAACAEAGGKPEAKPESGKPAANAGDKPVTFEFYSMLPKQQVVAPVNGNKTTVATPQPAPTPQPAAVAGKPATTATTTTPATATAPVAAPPPNSAPAATGKFLLQAGSFRTRDEADKRRAGLLLSGLSVSVAEAKVANGDTWFRVMVGPFASEAAMQKAQKQLSAMKVETLPVRPK